MFQVRSNLFLFSKQARRGQWNIVFNILPPEPYALFSCSLAAGSYVIYFINLIPSSSYYLNHANSNCNAHWFMFLNIEAKGLLVRFSARLGEKGSTCKTTENIELTISIDFNHAIIFFFFFVL